MLVLYHENGKLQRAYFPSRKDDSSRGVLTRDQIRTCNWTIVYLPWYVWVLECYFCWELGRDSRDEIYSWVWGAIVIITRTTRIINSASNNSLLCYIILYWHYCNRCIYGVYLFFCFNIIGKKRIQERVYMRWKTGDDIRITKTGTTLCKSKKRIRFTMKSVKLFKHSLLLRTGRVSQASKS